MGRKESNQTNKQNKHLGIFSEKQIYFIFCNLLFHFTNNYIKQYKSNVTIQLFSYDSSKTCIIRPFSTKMSAEVRDKQAYDDYQSGA